MVVESKKDLGLVEEALFECQGFDSTGILVCKLLLECLGRLREYKSSALKCMRYIVDALD
jgi:hypothetical protein